MATITAYHGTGKLERILNDGAVFCFDLAILRADESAEGVYNSRIEEYDELTAKLADVIRKERKERKRYFRSEWKFQQANESEEALADVAVSDGYAELDDAREYTELRRLTHVFLSDYKIAKNYADNGFKSIFEFEIPDDLVRPNPLSRSILVRKKVDLQYLKRLYVDEPHIEYARELLERYGHNSVEVDVIK